MPAPQQPYIAREGWTVLGVTAVVAVLLHALLGISASLPALVGLVVLGFMFRDPPRDPPALPLALVCPVDGRIGNVHIDTDPWLEREAATIAVTMGLREVHSIYAPTEGKVVEQWTHPRGLAADDSRYRDTVAYWLRTDEGDDVVLEVARGPWGGAIRFPYQPGERVGQGRRIGFALLGCRVRVYAPVGTRIDVRGGESALAALTVMATLVHETAVSAIEAPGD